MGVLQKVNTWLADRTDRFGRGGDANRIPTGSYYASNGAEQAYVGMRNTSPDTATADTGRAAPVDRFSSDSDDRYGGRVPYRSQKDMQAEAEVQRQQVEDQARKQQAQQQQNKTQSFGHPPAQQGFPQAQQAAYPQQNNVLPFPNLIRGPEGNLYAHVEYVVLLRSRNECTKVIEYIKANASVFLNMEFIANDSERQRCVDMLSGAAYTLGCHLNKISQRGIYLISSPSVYVVIDPAMQKYAATPESQGYGRPEYAPGYAGYGMGAQAAAPGYGAAGRMGGYAQSAPQQQPQTNAYAAPGNTGYRAARASTYAQPTQAQSNAAFAAQPTQTGYVTDRTAPYAAQNSAYSSASQTGSYAQQSTAGAQTGAFATAQPSAAGGQPRRSASAFGMQGPFMKSGEGRASR